MGDLTRRSGKMRKDTRDGDLAQAIIHHPRYGATSGEVRVGEDIGNGVDRTARDVAGGTQANHLGHRMTAGERLDNAVDQRAVGQPVGGFGVAFSQVGVVPDFESGVMATAQAIGVAGLRTNTVMAGWPTKPGRLEAWLRLMRAITWPEAIGILDASDREADSAFLKADDDPLRLRPLYPMAPALPLHALP